MTSKTTMYIAIAIVVIFVIVAGVLVYVYYKPGSPTPSGSNIDIYAGEVNLSTPLYGFGNSASSITSPGPEIDLTAGTTYTITLHNSGTMPHNFAIVDSKSSTANVLWSAQVKSNSNPVNPGSTGSVTFTAGSAGNYYYICQVDGHVALGMWGQVKVT
jgi:uncharacterized cupredoxin-like copper-binding protein